MSLPFAIVVRPWLNWALADRREEERGAGERMTYCLSIMTHEGLVMASDSRTNAGYDDLNVARKMHTFVQPGERVFVVLVSGSLSLSQSVINLVRASFDAGEGLAQANSMYEAAREIGQAVRQVSEIDRAALEKDGFSFNVHLLLSGQIRGEAPQSFLIYPQGNALSANEDSPFLQLGEYKYGRPILDRGIVFGSTTPEGCGQVCAAVVRRDDAVECDRRAADRAALVPQRQLSAGPLSPIQRRRSGAGDDSRPSGSGRCATRSRTCRIFGWRRIRRWMRNRCWCEAAKGLDSPAGLGRQ